MAQKHTGNSRIWHLPQLMRSCWVVRPVPYWPLVGSGGSVYAIRTVVVPHRLEPQLFRALQDVRGAVNHLLPDWIAHSDESRFASTKRSYPALRSAYPHLASGWWVTIANECSAVRNAWDRSLRRYRRGDPVRYERMRRTLPHRRRLKASLHPRLFRFEAARARLSLTLRAGVHLTVDLSQVRNPLFGKYGQASGWKFGLTLRPNDLLFHFRVREESHPPEGVVGVDLNFESANLAASDGACDCVDLRAITNLQERAARKRQSIQRHISKDLRHQRAVLRRYHRRENRRVTPLLHKAANEILAQAGRRAVVLEDLTDATQSILRREGPRRGPRANRRLSAWTHGRLAEIVSYKARTRIIWASPEGTSQECPRCGGRLALPSGGRVVDNNGWSRRTRLVVCGECGGRWHRDVAAAVAILARGRSILRGETITPSARNALLEAATWRPDSGDLLADRLGPGLPVEPMKGDDAKSGAPQGSTVR